MGDGINWFPPEREEIDPAVIADGKHIDEVLNHLEREAEKEKRAVSNRLLQLVDSHVTKEQRTRYLADLDTITKMIRVVRTALLKGGSPPEKLSMHFFILGALVGGAGRNISEARMFHSAVDLCRLAMENRQSEAGRKAAGVKHRSAEIGKSKFLSEWDATGSEYRGRADFARIVRQRDGLKEKERTLCGWIAAHEKTKA